MSNAPKVVGDLCPDCGTAYIAGQRGEGYCKPCYIKWAEANKAGGNTGSTAKPKASGYDSDGQSQGNAKNIAGLWVAHKIIKLEQFKEYCDKVYSYMPKKIGATQSGAGEKMKEAMDAVPKTQPEVDTDINVTDLPF